MFFSKKSKYQNNSEVDKYIKSHIPALYLLETDRFKNEEALLDDLAIHFSEQKYFMEQYKEMTPEFKELIAINYHTVKQLLADIEPEYIDNAIDELWEGLQEETIYGKYNKNGIISF